MKLALSALLITLGLSFSGFASEGTSEFRCRSYNTSRIIIAKIEGRTIIFKDRFGNELDVLEGVDTEFGTLDTDSEVMQTVFIKDGQIVFAVQQKEDVIRGIYKEDDSYQCRLVTE